MKILLFIILSQAQQKLPTIPLEEFIVIGRDTLTIKREIISVLPKILITPEPRGKPRIPTQFVIPFPEKLEYPKIPIYFLKNTILTSISSLPQLEFLGIFEPNRNHHIKIDLNQTYLDDSSFKNKTSIWLFSSNRFHIKSLTLSIKGEHIRHQYTKPNPTFINSALEFTLVYPMKNLMDLHISTMMGKQKERTMGFKMGVTGLQFPQSLHYSLNFGTTLDKNPDILLGIDVTWLQRNYFLGLSVYKDKLVFEKEKRIWDPYSWYNKIVRENQPYESTQGIRVLGGFGFDWFSAQFGGKLSQNRNYETFKFVDSIMQNFTLDVTIFSPFMHLELKKPPFNLAVDFQGYFPDTLLLEEPRHFVGVDFALDLKKPLNLRLVHELDFPRFKWGFLNLQSTKVNIPVGKKFFVIFGVKNWFSQRKPLSEREIFLKFGVNFREGGKL